MNKQTIRFGDKLTMTYVPEEDTFYELIFDNWKGPKKLFVELSKPGLECKITCAYKTGVDQKFNLNLEIKHLAKNTKCTVKVKGVLSDYGKSDFVGKVIIEKGAKNSCSRLEHGVLVTGQSTQNHSEPILLVEENSSNAYHASFTGRVDEDQCYYLQSRGLSKKEAVHILTSAFLSSVKV